MNIQKPDLNDSMQFTDRYLDLVFPDLKIDREEMLSFLRLFSVHDPVVSYPIFTKHFARLQSLSYQELHHLQKGDKFQFRRRLIFCK